MVQRAIIFSIAMCLISWSGALAMDISLEQALARAERDNLSLRAAKEALGVYRGRVLEARAFPNPQLSGEVEELPRLEITQVIPFPGKRSLRRESAERELSAKEALYEVQRLELRERVRNAFLDLVLARHGVGVAEEQVDLAQRLQSRLEIKFSAGAVPRAEYLRARVDLDAARSGLISATAEEKKSQVYLALLVGLPSGTPLIPLNAMDFRPFFPDTQSLIEKALRQRPELRSSRFAIEGAQAMEDLSKRLVLPDISVGLLWPRSEERREIGGSIGVEIPLFYRYRGEKVEAQARRTSLQLEKEALMALVEAQIHEAILGVNEAQSLVSLWEKALSQAEEAFKLVQDRYESGRTDLIVFLEAKRAYREARLSRFRSLRNWGTALAGLIRATGGEEEP